MPFVTFQNEANVACTLKIVAIPDDHLQFHLVAWLDMKPVKALRFLIAKASRCGGARLNHQGRPSRSHHFSGGLGISTVKMPCQGYMDASIVNGLKRILVPTCCFAKLVASANWQCK